MRVERAYYAFEEGQPPLVACSQLSLEWEGMATLSGPSGIGKTTFFRLLTGWFPPSSTAVCVYSDGIVPFRDAYLIGAQRSLLPWKTVADNICMHGFAASEIAPVLAEVDLSPQIAALFPYQLSAGMYKRVELVVGVLRNPQLLLLDEFYSSIADTQKPLVKDFLVRRRADKMTWIIAHEEQLRRWIGGPEFRFVIADRTIVDVTT